MLYIVFLFCGVLCFLLMKESASSCFPEHACVVAAIVIVIGIISFLSGFVMLFNYFEIKHTNDKQIAVIQEENEIVKKQIEPIIERYLNHEKETFEKIKIDGDNVVAYGMFPELKGNEIVQRSIQVIIDNQEKITQLKLEKANLDKYKIWLFIGE